MNTIGKGQVNRGTKNRKEQGIALTVMLVVLTFAATLSFGTLFLTQNNLKVAENIRNHAIAKYNAEAGIEVSHIMLNADWKETGKMPTANTADSMVPLAVSASETAFNYYLDPEVFNSTNNNVYLAIVGKSGPDASYTTEMLAKAVPASTSQSLPLPVYAKGIVSKTTVSINGMANTKLLSTGVHGNQGYTLNGKIKHVYTCIERNEDGTCYDFEFSANPWTYFTASAEQSNYTCNSHPSAPICQSGEPMIMADDPFNPWNFDGTIKDPQPAVINPRASLLLGLYTRGLVSAEALQTMGYLSSTVDLANFSLRELADTNNDGIANNDANYGPVDADIDLTNLAAYMCAQPGVNVYDGQSLNSASQLYSRGFRKNKVTCVTNGVNFPKNSDLEDMTIIVLNGSMNFNGSSDLDNTNLINFSSGVNLDSGDIDSSLVFAKQHINVNRNAEIKGVTSLLTDGNMTHNGKTVVASTDDGPIVGLNVVASGDITFNGRSDTYGIYQSRGSFRQNGHSDLFGSVLAEKSIIFNGGVEVDASMPISNPTLGSVEIVEQEAGFIMTGRR